MHIYVWETISKKRSRLISMEFPAIKIHHNHHNFTREYLYVVRWSLFLKWFTYLKSGLTGNYFSEHKILRQISKNYSLIQLIWKPDTGRFHIDGLVQERRNSIVNALELRLSATNPSIFEYLDFKWVATIGCRDINSSIGYQGDMPHNRTE